MIKCVVWSLPVYPGTDGIILTLDFNIGEASGLQRVSWCAINACDCISSGPWRGLYLPTRQPQYRSVAQYQAAPHMMPLYPLNLVLHHHWDTNIRA